MLKGAALLYSIVIAFVIGVLLSSLILYTYYNNLQLSDSRTYKKLLLNSNSGIILLLSKDNIIKSEESKTIDLFADGTDSVTLTRKQWGAFELIISKAVQGANEFKQVALTGYSFDPKTALYLAENGKPLSVSGKTRIIGDCFLPESGVKRAYIEGEAFEGTNLVEGKIEKSTSSLPEINKDLLKQILSYSKKEEHSKNKIDLSVPLVRSFDSTTLELYYDSPLTLKENISGNVIINCSGNITVTKDANLKDIILVAPKITLEKGVIGSFQAFASDSLIVSENCLLSYPSVLAVVTDDPLGPGQGLIVHSNSTVRGILFAYRQKMNNNSLPRIEIKKDATVEGIIYSSGLAELKGNLFGTLYASSLILTTPSSVYENHLLNATIDAHRLSPYFVSAGLFDNKTSKNIVKWLH